MDQSARSPFAALSPQEQKEQWICWQAARRQEEVQEVMQEPEAPCPEPPAPAMRHGQYDAVIRRLKQARRGAQPFQRWE